MELTYEITMACGHTESRSIRYDGRRKPPLDVWTGQERKRVSVAGYVHHQQQLQAREFPTEMCLTCTRARKRAATRGLWTTSLFGLSVTAVRAITHVVCLTGGSVSESPKSSSHYVTWATGAWRISDHPWPGRPESLLAEHKAGRYWVARLRPDWLRKETTHAAA